MASSGKCAYAYINTTTTPFGIVSSASPSDTEAVIHNEGIGGVDRMTGPLVVPTLNIDYLPFSAAATTAGMFATSGYPCSEPAAYTLGIGAGAVEYTYGNAKCNSTTISCESGGRLQVSQEWWGLTLTENAFSKPDQSGTNITPFSWNQSVITLTGVAYDLQSFSVSIENNLEAITDLDATTIRTPDSFVAIKEVVELDIKTLTPIAASVRGNLADTLLTNHTFSAVFNNGVTTYTISLAGGAFSDGSFDVGTDGLIEYNYKLTFPILTAASVAIS